MRTVCSGLNALVFTQAGRLALIGLLVGLVLALPVGRAVQGLLFEVSATDVTSLAIAALMLIGVSVIGAAAPARKDTQSDPALALRSE